LRMDSTCESDCSRLKKSFSPASHCHCCIGGPDVIRKEAWPLYRIISGVRLSWKLEEPQTLKGGGAGKGMRASCSAHRETPGLKLQGDGRTTCRAAARLGDLTGGETGGERAEVSVTKCAMLAGAPPLPPDYTAFEGEHGYEFEGRVIVNSTSQIALSPRAENGSNARVWS